MVVPVSSGAGTEGDAVEDLRVGSQSGSLAGALEKAQHFQTFLPCTCVFAFLTAFAGEALGYIFCVLVTGLPAWCPASMSVKAEFPRNLLVLKHSLCWKPFLDTG